MKINDSHGSLTSYPLHDIDNLLPRSECDPM